jgi:hypothetical protein
MMVAIYTVLSIVLRVPGDVGTIWVVAFPEK